MTSATTWGSERAAAGLLTTGPLLCLGLLAPLGPRIARRFAVERILLVACFATALGTAARGIGGAPALYLGTLLAGAAIALSQVVTPAWVRAKAAQGTGVLTGAFSWALVAGATIATFTAIPLENLFGGWEGALAIWGLVGVAASAVWLPRAIKAHEPVPAPDREPLWRHPMAWSIAGLMGLQSMAFFSTISWLPEILTDDGLSDGYAGFLAGLTQLVQLLPAFLVPVLAARRDLAGRPADDHRRDVGDRAARRAAGERVVAAVDGVPGDRPGRRLGVGADVAGAARPLAGRGRRDGGDGDGRRVPDRRRGACAWSAPCVT